MKLRSLLLAAALLALAAPASAQGLFPGLPASTSAGTAPNNAGSDSTGAAIVGDENIPMDTGLANGLNPQTELVSPDQLANYIGGTTPRIAYSTVPVGSVAYGSFGTSTTPVAGTIYWAQLNLPQNMTITNISCLNGGTAATDKLIYGLWDDTGALLANTALAGTLAANADTFQSIALTATYAAVRGKYYVGWQTNGTTTRVRTVAASTFIDEITTSQTGTFGTLPAITTIVATFTADKGPICLVN